MYSEMDYLFMEQEVQGGNMNNNHGPVNESELLGASLKSMMSSFFTHKRISFSTGTETAKRSGVSPLNSCNNIDTLEKKNSLVAEYNKLFLDYKNIYEKIVNLESDYKENKSNKGNVQTLVSNSLTRGLFSMALQAVPTFIYSDIDRSSEIVFINSVLEEANNLESCSVDINEESSLIDRLTQAIDKIKESHILMIGACFYIHQRIESEYEREQLVNSELYNLLTTILIDTPQDQRVLSLKNLSTVVDEIMLSDYDSDEEERDPSEIIFSIKLPIHRYTKTNESKDAFKKNIEEYTDKLDAAITTCAL